VKSRTNVLWISYPVKLLQWRHDRHLECMTSLQKAYSFSRWLFTWRTILPILSRSDMNWGALCLVSSVPLPFCRCRCARERNCWKRLPLTAFEVTRTLIGCPPYDRTAKIGFDLICYGTAVTAQRQVGTGTAQRNLFYVDNVILTALTEFLLNLCNGNGRTATERWKLGIGFYEEHRPKNRTTWAAIGDQFLVVTF